MVLHGGGCNGAERTLAIAPAAPFSIGDAQGCIAGPQRSLYSGCKPGTIQPRTLASLMRVSAPASARSATSRRKFLYVAAAAVGAAGATAGLWPLIDQMNPEASVRAAGDIVDVDLVDLRPGDQRVVFWHRFPIFVVHRTDAMLALLGDKAFTAQLADADSQTRQQPAYARNWHRSVEPRYAVLVGICTRCSCVPRFVAEAVPDAVIGGYVCPCCAARYDPAGRAYAGVTRYNLPVPPHQIDARSRLLSLGKNPPGELFMLDAVERI